MSKPKRHEVLDPDELKPRDVKRERKFGAALFRMTDEQVRRREETTKRHTRFENEQHKGSRGARNRRAIDDASE